MKVDDWKWKWKWKDWIWVGCKCEMVIQDLKENSLPRKIRMVMAFPSESLLQLVIRADLDERS